MPGYNFRLHPGVSRWLDEGEGGETNRAFAAWLDSVEFGAETLRLGNVWVDPAVLRARFLCRPSRCAPWAGRERWRCCCADVAVAVENSERQRLLKKAEILQAVLRPERPRLALRGTKAWFFEKNFLNRPSGRCVFSTRDRWGRIRCVLYWAAERLGVEIDSIQPFSCRLFPLIVVRLGRERVLLSVVNQENYRAFGTFHPRHFGCLTRGYRPPLIKSMTQTLDWLFGVGFSRFLSCLNRI